MHTLSHIELLDLSLAFYGMEEVTSILLSQKQNKHDTNGASGLRIFMIEYARWPKL